MSLNPAVPNLLCGSVPAGSKRLAVPISMEEKANSNFRSATSRTLDSRKRANERFAHQNQIKRGIDPRATERHVSELPKARTAIIGETPADLSPTPLERSLLQPRSSRPLNLPKRPEKPTEN